MEIPLHYGNDVITLEIPPKNVADVLRPQRFKSEDSNIGIVSKAIQSRKVQFQHMVKGFSVGLLLPDGTRDMPSEDILSSLLPLLKGAQKLLFFLCTGSHQPQTEANNTIVEMIKSQAVLAGIQSYQIVSHDCQTEQLSNAGVTSYGTEVLYNSRLEEVDIFCILSDVKHHYFAGYSNPIKNIVPGLCGFKTIEQNHSLTFDSQSRAGIHPWHPDPTRRENPLAVDLLEAMGRIVDKRPVWTFVTVSDDGAIQWADFGPAKDVTSQAFQKADEWNMRRVEKVDFIIVSPGGLPNDVDLYIAQRALELTNSAINDDGEILFLAACPNGIGSALTKERFETVLFRPLTKILECDSENYHLFEHKPYRFAQLIKRLKRVWFHSEISDSMVQGIHMVPSNDPQTVVNDWISNNPEIKVLLVDGANKLLLIPKNE